MIISSSEDIPPFQVFTQKTLYEMCAYFPLTSEQLRAIHGMGKIRVSKYGDEILEVIREYVKKNNITPKPILKEKKKTKATKAVGASQKESLAMFQAGKTPEEIAKERGFVQGTILGHLSQFIKSGEVKMEKLIPKDRLKELLQAESNIKYDSLTDLKAQIDDKFTYAELRMLMNYKAFKENH
jgi:ribonuclease D